MGFEDLKQQEDKNQEDITIANETISTKVKSFLLQDSMLFGTIMGLILPLVSYFLIGFINSLFSPSDVLIQTHYLEQSTVYVLSIVANLIIFRYYMIKRKADKTGRGILLSTILYAIAFFAFFNKM